LISLENLSERRQGVTEAQRTGSVNEPGEPRAPPNEPGEPRAPPFTCLRYRPAFCNDTLPMFPDRRSQGGDVRVGRGVKANINATGKRREES
jgi:hypothetical protein